MDFSLYYFYSLGILATSSISLLRCFDSFIHCLHLSISYLSSVISSTIDSEAMKINKEAVNEASVRTQEPENFDEEVKLLVSAW